MPGVADPWADPAATRRPRLLLDTSVAVPAVVSDHEHHAAALQLVSGSSMGYAGHAWFETYSVLTRLPLPQRRTGEEALLLMAGVAPTWLPLPEDAARALIRRLVAAGVVGGAVYDALIGAAAAAATLPLVTMDRRAASTYLAVGAETQLLVS